VQSHNVDENKDIFKNHNNELLKNSFVVKLDHVFDTADSSAAGKNSAELTIKTIIQ
jgi:hypothetical protein